MTLSEDVSQDATQRLLGIIRSVLFPRAVRQIGLETLQQVDACLYAQLHKEHFQT